MSLSSQLESIASKRKEAEELASKLNRSVHAQNVFEGENIYERGSFTLCSVRANYGKTFLRAFLKYEDGFERPITTDQYIALNGGSLDLKHQ